jgi:hypothetical protein
MNRFLFALSARRRLLSFSAETPCPHARLSWRIGLHAFLAFAFLLAGCGSDTSKPAESQQKPAQPPVPDEVQEAAKMFLGSEVQVLMWGDLALNGKQEFVAANVVPNTPKKMVAGTAVTRAVVAENDDGKWVELMRADEHLKNQKGYLGLTPLQPVSGWKLQYEQPEGKTLALYFTPISNNSSERTIAVKYNPETKRYQSMDLNYEHFLLEAPALDSPRSMLR